jgi:hypothetical protein
MVGPCGCGKAHSCADRGREPHAAAPRADAKTVQFTINTVTALAAPMAAPTITSLG